MIVYRDIARIASAADCLSGIAALLKRMSSGKTIRYDEAAELVITIGEIESAVTDLLCRDCDRRDPVIAAYRGAGTAAGHIFCTTWEQRDSEALGWIDRLRPQIDELSRMPDPGELRVSVPEGYAFYALFPEMYYEAARRCFQEIKLESAVCIGIRSIGTSLSAIVAAALEDRGCHVETITLRPRGHAFNRTVSLSAEFREYFRSRIFSCFLIIDEGPGLSGSSFCCIAQMLADLGAGDERIIFFPSWVPDETKFNNDAAKRRWPKHRKYTVSFEDVWLANGRLGRAFGCGGAIDISAGKWRALFYENESESPAVFSNAERRKYLCVPSGLASDTTMTPSRMLKTINGGRIMVAKFAGLGRYGRDAFARAETIARAGFAPPVLGLVDGFLLYRFLPGNPVSAGRVGDGCIDALAGYLAFIFRRFPSNQETRFDEMIGMVRCNVREGLGSYWIDRFDRSVAAFSATCRKAPPVAGDGRMLPYKWIDTGNSFLKIDGADHHADHFFPGCQDIAWDIAGSCVEFALDGERKDRLLDRYTFLSLDTGCRDRLPFTTIAYCAFRLGYASLAADVSAATPDERKFRRLIVRYAAALRQAIHRGAR